jgi:tetratricopeptide (TPR) repeat protein
MVDCYVTLGDYKKAEGLLRGFEKYSEEKGLFLLERAKVAREVGDFKSSSRFYEKLTVLEPENLKAYISLADAYADMNENIERADSLFAFSCKMDSSLFYENIETLAWILYRKSHFEEALQNINIAVDRELSRKATSVLSRRRLPRIYYRKAIIAQTRGEKKIKEEAIKNSLSSQFCNGYIRKQINYLLGSPR